MKTYKVKVNGKLYEVQLEAVSEEAGSITTNKEASVTTPVSGGKNEILAPIAGKVIDVKVKVGDTVKKGQTIAIIEAMKLENEVQSAFDGKVVDVKVAKGAAVNNKDVLIVLG